MLLSSVAPLFIAHTTIRVLAFRIGRGIPQPVDLISSVASPDYRHPGYIDQKVRQHPYRNLNHESWHQRNVASIPANAFMGPSNITSDIIAVDEAFILPATSPSNKSTNTSSSIEDARFSGLPELLQSKKTLGRDAETDATWDNQTDTACTIALDILHGIASNPSGLAACYNIRSYNEVTGTFKADIRLYQIAAPTDGWAHLQTSTESLDIKYNAAQITKSTGMHKRGSISLDLSAFTEVQSEALYLRRDRATPPNMLQGLTLLGMIVGDNLIASMDQ